MAGQLLQVSLGTLTFIIVARSLGALQFGPFAAVAALNQMVAPLTDLSFSTVLVRNTARVKSNFRADWGETLMVFVCCAALLTALIFLIARSVIKPVDAWPLLALVIVADLLLRRFSFVVAAAFQAREEFGKMALMGALAPAATLGGALLWAFVFDGATLTTWVRWYFCASALAAAAAGAVLLQCVPRPQFARRPRLQHWRDALLFLMTPGAQGINNDIDKVILSSTQTAASVGAYSLAYRIVLAALLPLVALRTATASEYFRAGLGGVGAAARLAVQRLWLNLLIGCAVSAALFALAPAIAAFFGAGFPQMADMLKILAFLPILKALQFNFGNVLSGSGRQLSRVLIQGGAAALSVCLCLVFIPRWGWQGAAWTSLLADGLLALMLIARIFGLIRNGPRNREKKG